MKNQFLTVLPRMQIASIINMTIAIGLQPRIGALGRGLAVICEAGTGHMRPRRLARPSRQAGVRFCE